MSFSHPHDYYVGTDPYQAVYNNKARVFAEKSTMAKDYNPITHSGAFYRQHGDLAIALAYHLKTRTMSQGLIFAGNMGE